MSAVAKLGAGLNANAKAGPVKASSLKDFLLTYAKVKMDGGEYGPYTFEGRQVLEHITDRFDMILGSHTGEPLIDARFDICGGAQWGKTIFALNFGVYLTSCRFMNWGYYLPDDDLVNGVVESKLRPDVVEQIEGLGSMMEMGVVELQGKGQAKRKSVNRKGAFQVSDGTRKAFAMIRGMGKIPTTFSMDCAMEDEKDDIKEKNAKFLSGRMTASKLRLSCSIGTQRKHGMGQHKQFMAGTQEVQMFDVPGEGRMINLEENWPQICRLAVTGKPRADDPQLTMAGNFKRGENEAEETFDYDPTGHFYLADPATGKVIDRDKPHFVERRPERARLRRWSIRVSQIAIAALSLHQPLSRWQEAVKDPETMEVFYCDVLALPRNSSQALTPEIITRSRSIEQPFDLRLSMRPGCTSYAGVDTGNRCWFFAREVESEFVKRALWAEQINLGDVVRRSVHLARLLKVGCLMVDAHPHVDQARSITYALNNLEGITWPVIDKPDKERIEFPGGMVWDGPNSRFENLAAAVVQFTVKQGGGTIHKLGTDQQDGVTRYYPIIQCNRFDLVNRVVNEFLTPQEQVSRVTSGGKVVEEPVMRMPQRVAGSPVIIETLEAHLVTGSDKDEKGDFVDECENHLLLADGYSALAELIGSAVRIAPASGGYEPVEALRPENRRMGGGL